MKNCIRIRLAACLALLVVYPGVTALAAGNASAGAMTFEEECAECHTVTGKNKKGPSLRGVIGRRAGTAPGFDEYSDAVKKSGVIWTAEALNRYLTSPKQFSPSIRMKFDGLPDAKVRADLIEFLATKK